MKVSRKQLYFYAIDKNILIVDDDPIIQDTLFAVFKDFYKKVFIASNGKEALEIFENNNIDLVLSDINMPIMNGIELAKKLKLKSEVHIIILSAIDDTQQLIDLINVGVDKFINKPFEFQSLAQAMINILENQSYKELIHTIESCNQSQEISFDDKNKSSIINLSDISTPLELFKYLMQSEDKARIHSKFHSIFVDCKLLEKLLKDLMLFSANIDGIVDPVKVELLFEKISKRFLSIYYKILDFDLLKPLSDIMFDYHVFFGKFKNLDDFTSKQLDELLDIEQFFIDFKEVVNAFFVHQSKNNFSYFYDKLINDLEDLDNRVSNADTMVYD
jgi:DNA-binding response OmpR family regulator